MASKTTGFDRAALHQRRSSDESRLKRMARRFLSDYPDIHGQAYVQARRILKKHSAVHLDPDKVYWHRFTDGTRSSPRTFTGWEHVGQPAESMTLVELVMHRFSAQDQDATPGTLQQMGGFYTDGPECRVFNERNEVPLLPRDVLNDFWAADFASTYKSAVTHFWAAHGENFRTLAKAHFLAAAANAKRAGRLQDGQYRTVIHAVASSVPDVMTGALLRARITPQPGITFRSFDIGEYIAHDIVRIVDGSGVQILYMPAQRPAFHFFASEAALQSWVLGQCATDVSRSAFTLHFFSSQAAKEQDGGVFDSWIGQLQRHEWSDQKVINRVDHEIVTDVFEHLRELAQANMNAQAHLLLTSNSDLRKQMMMGYLNAFTQVFDGIAPLAWPLTLTLVGAALTNVGLSIDQALNGNTSRLRKAGVISAILNSVFVVFNLPDLAGAGAALSDSGAVIETVEDWVPAYNSEASLAELRGNVILDEDIVDVSGHMRGIRVRANGETWIEIHNLPYRVSYNSSLRTWTIVDPENPFAFFGFKPVRLNAHDDWELLAPPQLAGGSPLDDVSGSTSPSAPQSHSMVSTKSAFWDTYMRFDLLEEERLSKIALARQKAVVDDCVREYDPDSDFDSDMDTGGFIKTDEDGNRLLVDAWGDEHRLFKTEGEYMGGRVSDYTARDADFNVYLRTGESTLPNQIEMIEELAEDIDSIGCNNDVDLYRGGSGHRSTSGITFRSGKIKAGDILVNTDFTSFSENPYVARIFSSSQGGVQSHIFQLHINDGAVIRFDDTSIVFELPSKTYRTATPISPFSGDWEEAESVFKPGTYFRIESIEEVVGEHFKFIKVRLSESPAGRHRTGEPAGRIFDLRTGEPFSREQYAAKLGPQGASLLELFFPSAT
ncbi:dermonecrotic toxin domain-containing protein [Pseudomonas sp. Irchel 3A5]|uniref:dermonecrotic toxin domain-containing protein n=1 Tax=Pseudomonas sp. Irchel 3A5 TaxID=2008911 RepID=UPI000BA2F8D9|nr:DUF6543 domain-containing protein [Pseudomonas sp. Irchel 3A5]